MLAGGRRQRCVGERGDGTVQSAADGLDRPYRLIGVAIPPTAVAANAAHEVGGPGEGSFCTSAPVFSSPREWSPVGAILGYQFVEAGGNCADRCQTWCRTG